MTLQAVLFDLDGTLVDTNYLHVHAWWEAFRGQGHQVSAFDIHRALGLPSADLVRSLLGEEDEAVVDGHAAGWEELRPGVQAFHRAGDLLRACADQGWKVVWATSGSPEDIEAIRGVLDADDAIDAIVGSADVERGKPHPDVVVKALDGIDPADAVMLGDTVWDVRAAVAAGVRCVGVLAGGISEKELVDAGAAAVVGNPSELLDDLSVLG